MRRNLIGHITLLASLALLASASLSSALFSQDQENSQQPPVVQQGQRAKFERLTPRYLDGLLVAPASSTVPNWSSSFTSGGTTFPFTMVGTNPANTNTTTTITTFFDSHQDGLPRPHFRP